MWDAPVARSQRPIRREWTDAQKQDALRLAASIGTRPAARELDLSTASLFKWKRDFPELWSSLTAGTAEDDRTKRFASRLEDLADTYADLEVEAIDRAAKLIPRAEAKELAALMKGLSTGRATAITGARNVRGEPDSTTELNINFPALEQAMEVLLNGGNPQQALPVPNEAE